MNRLGRMKNKGLIQEYNITQNFVLCDYKAIVIFEFNYKTIGVVEQRGLLEITRDLGKLLTKEEFDEIMMVYEKVTDRLLAEVEKQGMDI